MLARLDAAAHMSAMQQTVIVNGDPHSFAPPFNVANLIAMLGLDARKIAIECNEAIVPRSTYDSTWLSAGDRLEIVHFIGGG